MNKFKYTISFIAPTGKRFIYSGYYFCDKDMRDDVRHICPNAQIIFYKREMIKCQIKIKRKKMQRNSVTFGRFAQ